jgi:hypothetical protein
MFRRLVLLAVLVAFAAAPASAWGAGAMELRPDPVDYHRVTVGATVTKKVTVINVGDTTLNILAYSVDAERAVDTWRIISGSCGSSPLLPGDRCRFGLELTPGAVGDAAASVYVRSYNYETGTYDVQSPTIAAVAHVVG